MPATFEAVVKTFAQRAASDALPVLDQRDRAAFVLAARYGCESCTSTLQGIGDHLGLTRERVRQILKELSSATPNGEHASLIKRLDADIRNFLPTTLGAANEHFRKELGNGPGIDHVMAFAHDFLGRAAPVPLKPRALPWGGRARVKVEFGGAEWAKHALRVASDATNMNGGTSLEAVAGRLAFDLGTAVSRKQLAAVLQGHPEFKWLDEQEGWLAIDGRGHSRLEQRLSKLLALSDDGLTIDDLRESLAVEPRRTGDCWALLPYQAMVQRLKTIPWLDVQHRHGLTTRKKIDPERVLSPSEMTMVVAIEARGGMATTGELVDAVKEAGETEDAARQTIRSTPILRQIAPATFVVRGRRPRDPSTLMLAWTARRW